jgi:hypothetical protein
MSKIVPMIVGTIFVIVAIIEILFVISLFQPQIVL